MFLQSKRIKSIASSENLTKFLYMLRLIQAIMGNIIKGRGVIDK